LSGSRDNHPPCRPRWRRRNARILIITVTWQTIIIVSYILVSVVVARFWFHTICKQFKVCNSLVKKKTNKRKNVNTRNHNSFCLFRLRGGGGVVFRFIPIYFVPTYLVFYRFAVRITTTWYILLTMIIPTLWQQH